MRKKLFLMALLFSFLANAQTEKPQIFDNAIELNKLRKEFKGYDYLPPIPDDNNLKNKFLSEDNIRLIMKSKDKEKKNVIVKELLEMDNGFIFSKELQSILIDNLDCNEKNYDLIWLVGIKKFEGYIGALEKKMPHYSIECQAAMLYLLALDGSSKIGFEFLKNLLKLDTLDFYSNDKLLDALNFYIEHGKPGIKEKAVNLGLEMYNGRVLYNNILKNIGKLEAEYKEDLLVYYLITFGGKETLTLAKSSYNIPKHKESALAALLKDDPNYYKNELNSVILNEDNYGWIGYRLGIDYFNMTKDTSILIKVIDKYCKAKYKDCVINKDIFKAVDKASHLLNNKSIVEKLRYELMIREKNGSDIAQDLYNNNVIDKSVIENLVQSISGFQKSTSTTSALHFFIFNTSEFSTPFNFQNNEFPFKYEETISSALTLAKNEIGSGKIFVKRDVNENEGSANQAIFIDFGHYGLFAQHYSNSPEPSFDFVLGILNSIASYSQSSKRYYIDFFTYSNLIFYGSEARFANFKNYLQKELR